MSSDVEIVTIDDPDYPRRLQSIELPPHVLYVRGDPAALTARHAVAIVGTRRPTEAGRLTASRLGAAIARAGAVVVSGLAVGIDGAAHAAVVQEGGATVAVLGLGLAAVLASTGTTAPPPPVPPGGVAAILLTSLAAVSEEAFFRRFLYGRMLGYGAGVAVAGSALSFALIHVPEYGARVLPLDFAAGLLLSWQRWASGSWAPSAFTHVFANLVQLR